MSFLWYWPAGGWDFDKWKQQNKWEPILSQQSGNAKLGPLMNPTETLAGWKKDAAYWRGISDQIRGTLTDQPPAKPEWEWLGDSFEAEAYSFRRMRYRLTSDEWGYAWLLKPKGGDGKK